MKNSFKSIIFAVSLGSLLTIANGANANDRYSATNEVILVRGAEVNFSDFMSKKAKKIVKSDNWNIFTEVVTLYNISPSKFLTVSSDKKQAFNESVEQIQLSLDRKSGKNAKVWKAKVERTAAVINALWNYQVKSEEVEIEQVEAPALIEALGL